MTVTAGDTVLLREGGVLRWVRITHALRRSLRTGRQVITVVPVEHIGSKPRIVTLGSRNVIVWLA